MNIDGFLHFPSDTPSSILEVVAEDLECADLRGILHMGPGIGAGVIISHEMEKADTDENTTRLFMRFLTLVQQNCREWREVAWYASELCVTPKYLSAICQKVTGKSALHWIEYYAVHEILLLLNDPALTLTEVTDRMHFPAPPMLTRYLKRTIGKTPSEYRMGQA